MRYNDYMKSAYEFLLEEHLVNYRQMIFLV